MRNLVHVCAVALALSASAEFKIQVDEKTQKYTILDDGKPVLTYNYGIVPVPEGVTGKYAVQRSNYIHPLYGPNGEVLTADYQKDHAHHRGIYWAWPEVSYKGELRDLHALQGVFARPVRMIRQEATKDRAIIETEHVWKWGDTEEIVRENATITVQPILEGCRIIDFQFRLEGLKPKVTIARRQQSVYGGFNVRMSSRKDQQITKHIGTAAQSPLESWAELVGIPPEGKEPIGVFLLQKPSNPLYPGDWVDFPNLNWLQPTFPSKGMAFTLTPGKPLDLAYRIIIRSGAGLKEEPAKLFASYAKESPDPLAASLNYKLGESRLALTAFEESLRQMCPVQRPVVEKRLLALLTAPSSPDFKRWACKHLQVVGSDASISIALTYLTQEAWMEAGDLLLSLPGQKSLQSVIRIIPQLEGERRATLIHALGLRQDDAVVSALATYANDPDQQTSSAALIALSKIQGVASADALLALKPTNHNATRILEAKLANASIQKLSNPHKAKALFESVYNDATAKSCYKGAALIGLTALNPAEMSKKVVNMLTDNDRQLRRAAATAFRLLDITACESLRTQFSSLPKETQLLILPLWTEQRMTSTEPEVLTCLESSDNDLKWAAVVALRKMGTAAAIPKLLAVAAGGGPLAKETESTLQQIRGEVAVNILRKASQENETVQSALAVKILAARMDPGCIPFLLEVVAGTATKKSEIALTTIKNQADREALPQLRKLLLEKPELKDYFAQAIIAICKRQPDVKELLSSFLDTPIKAEIEGQLKTL